MTTPRIYVACLASYNAGKLHGVWIDADQEPANIQEAVDSMLAASSEPFAEEWAIHDFEGFGLYRLSEWESFERVSAIARGIAEHGLAFAGWLSYDSTHDPSDITTFEDAYQGEWDSMHDCAEAFAEGLGLFDQVNALDSPYITVDVDLLERDLTIEMYTVESDDGIYVFNMNG